MRNKIVVIFLASSLTALFLFNASNFDFDILINPMGGMAVISGDGLNVNLPALALSLLLIPLAFASLAFYPLASEKTDYSVLLAPLAVSMIILFLNGFSMLTFSVVLAFMLSCGLTLRLSYFDAEIYKKISPYKICSHAVSRGLLALNLIMVLAVFVTISGASFEEQIKEEFTDMIMANLAEQFDSPEGVMGEQIRQQIEQNREQVAQMIESNPMIRTLINIYPYLAVLGLFAVLEFLRGLLFAPLAGIYCSLMWRL